MRKEIPLFALAIALLALLGSAGCIAVPTGKETVLGPNYSKEALAFLDLPETTREDAISSLGAPDLECKDSGILAYMCKSGTKWASAGVIPVPFTHRAYAWAGEHCEVGALNALLIAYDQSGHIYNHKVSQLAGDDSLHEMCDEWKRLLQRSRK